MLREPASPANTLPVHHIDELTGYANRAWLNENLPKAIETHSGNCGVLFVDIDGLKKVNDSEGHSAGDKLIQDTADSIDISIRAPSEYRPGDTVGRLVRLSGDELVVLLTGVKTPEDLVTVKARIIQNLEEKSISASIGGALHTGEISDSASELLGRADAEMYKEKEARKAQQIEKLSRTKRVAAKFGRKLLDYSGVNPPR